MEKQEPLLKTQTALLAFQASASYGVLMGGGTRPSYSKADVDQKLKELGLE